MLEPAGRRWRRPALAEECRIHAEESSYAAACRLAGRIVRGEQLRQRLQLLDFYLEQEIHDLWQACRWADRIQLCQERLARDREEIRRIWRELWLRVGETMVRGGETTPLDRFCFWSHTYREAVLAGKVTWSELDAGYDWERECFRPDFRDKMAQIRGALLQLHPLDPEVGPGGDGVPG